MMNKGIKKYLINPSLGLLPGLLYILLFGITKDIALSLIVAIIVSGVGDLVFRFYAKASICGLVFLMNFIALSLTLTIWSILGNIGIANLFYIIVYEIILFCLIFLSRVSKTYIHLYSEKKKPSIIQKTFLSEYFEVAKFTQYTIIFHIFILILCRYFLGDMSAREPLDTILYYIIPVIFASIIIIYEEIKTRNIVKNLRREEWLPIVSESGEVTGRIARSVSVKMKNRFLHPVVRVALLHNGKLYLQERPTTDKLDPSTLDHPFEKYMQFSHEINIAVRNSISRALNMQELPFNFLLKYVYENENTKRLIFLFVSRIENDTQLNSLSLLKGKFWTMKQIKDSFNDKDVFSECFQLEYEYLKNTVLQPEILKKDVPLNQESKLTS